MITPDILWLSAWQCLKNSPMGSIFKMIHAHGTPPHTNMFTPPCRLCPASGYESSMRFCTRLYQPKENLVFHDIHNMEPFLVGLPIWWLLQCKQCKGHMSQLPTVEPPALEQPAKDCKRKNSGQEARDRFMSHSFIQLELDIYDMPGWFQNLGHSWTRSLFS